MPSESKVLYTLVDPISPPSDAASLPSRSTLRHVVEAPGTAPGSEQLITTAFIAIAGRIRQTEYMLGSAELKVSPLAAVERV